MEPTTITTERLVLRSWEVADLEPVLARSLDPEFGTKSLVSYALSAPSVNVDGDCRHRYSSGAARLFGSVGG